MCNSVHEAIDTFHKFNEGRNPSKIERKEEEGRVRLRRRGRVCSRVQVSALLIRTSGGEDQPA